MTTVTQIVIPHASMIIQIISPIVALIWAADFTLRYFPRIFTLSIFQCLHLCSILVHRNIQDGAGSAQELCRNLEQLCSKFNRGYGTMLTVDILLLLFISITACFHAIM